MLLSLLYKATPGKGASSSSIPRCFECHVRGHPATAGTVVTDIAQASARCIGCGRERWSARYKLMSAFAVRNLASYNQRRCARASRKKEPLKATRSPSRRRTRDARAAPLMVVVIDEIAT